MKARGQQEASHELLVCDLIRDLES
jgi:hypothetical protein